MKTSFFIVCEKEVFLIGKQVKRMEVHKKSNAWALFPLLLFVALFLGVGIITGDFTSMPLNVAITITVIVALLMNRKESFAKKVEVFTKGAGHSNIILMMLIFILAGAFSNTAEKMGGVKSTVNLGLSLIPENLIIVGLFVSISMGTSVGTVAAIAPVGYGFAQATDVPTALAMATVVGGAMFGDNLSMISDTTIAAVRTQHTKMKDKFRVNFKIVLPGAILTIIILYFLTNGISLNHAKNYDYNLIKVVPYILVLVLALLGVNVIIVLIGGTLLAGIIGLIDGSFSWMGLLDAVSKGIISMEDIAMIALLIGGLVGIIQHNGAKNIADEYDVDSRKSASILDIFGGCFQGLLPYSPQVISAAGVAGISPLMLFPYSIYPILLGVCGLIAILFNFPKLKKNTSQEIKH